MVSRISRPSLASLAVELLKTEIKRGTWSGLLPGERTLCDLLGVSRPTLRSALRLLHDEGWVEIIGGKGTRITGAAGVGGVPARLAIRFLSPVPLHEMPPFMVCWVDLLRERLASAGRGLELVVSKKAYSRQPGSGMKTMVESLPPSVWILFRSGEPLQRWFESNAVRCLVAGSVVEGVDLPSVDVDNRAVCRHAAGLFKARGRRSAVLVVPDNMAVGDAESWAGFVEGFGEGARRVCHDGTAEGLRSAVRLAMRSRPRPDGFLVARSAHVLTVLTDLLRSGVRVPEEVAVISRDDDTFLAHTVPMVARYSSDPRVWRDCVFRWVEKLATGELASCPKVRLMPKLIEGESLP